jgi:hypothetical protein
MQHPFPSQALPVQQGPPAPPQRTHERTVLVAVTLQTVPGSVHIVPVVQQARLSRPHSQRPATQVPAPEVVGMVQAARSATHRPAVQHAVPMQVLPGQQGLPATPQGRQVLLVVSQTVPGSLQRLPGQQAPPAPPQVRHWLVDEQTVVGSLQVPPEVAVAVVGQQA